MWKSGIKSYKDLSPNLTETKLTISFFLHTLYLYAYRVNKHRIRIKEPHNGKTNISSEFWDYFHFFTIVKWITIKHIGKSFPLFELIKTFYYLQSYWNSFKFSTNARHCTLLNHFRKFYLQFMQLKFSYDIKMGKNVLKSQKLGKFRCSVQSLVHSLHNPILCRMMVHCFLIPCASVPRIPR